MILDDFRLDGKTALVTRASRGLGAGIAKALSQAGARVVCHGNTTAPEAVCEAISEIGRPKTFSTLRSSTTAILTFS